MTPDEYMPFFWPEFWSAVNGQQDDVIVAYLRAISHYWHQCKCSGLEDNSEYLRKVCMVEKEHWPRIQEKVFDNSAFFTIEIEGNKNVWHQKRAKSEWKKAKSSYDWACKRTANATKARWAKHR